jgi:hypothetical protein
MRQKISYKLTWDFDDARGKASYAGDDQRERLAIKYVRFCAVRTFKGLVSADAFLVPVHESRQPAVKSGYGVTAAPLARRVNGMHPELLQLRRIGKKEGGNKALDDRLEKKRPGRGLRAIVRELVQSLEDALPVTRLSLQSNRWEATSAPHDIGEVMLHSRHHHHGRNSAIIIGRSGEVWKQPVAHIFVGHAFFHQRSNLLRHGTNLLHVRAVRSIP